MLLALKISTDENFEDYFHHVNQMLNGRTQVQTFVEKTWLAQLKGHHLTWLFLGQFLNKLHQDCHNIRTTHKTGMPSLSCCSWMPWHVFLHVCKGSRAPPGSKTFHSVLGSLSLHQRSCVKLKALSSVSGVILSDSSLFWWSTLIPESSGALAFFMSAFQPRFMCTAPFWIWPLQKEGF